MGVWVGVVPIHWGVCLEMLGGNRYRKCPLSGEQGVLGIGPWNMDNKGSNVGN